MRWLVYLRCLLLHDMPPRERKVAGRKLAWCDRCQHFRYWSF